MHYFKDLYTYIVQKIKNRFVLYLKIIIKNKFDGVSQVLYFTTLYLKML